VGLDAKPGGQVTLLTVGGMCQTFLPARMKKKLHESGARQLRNSASGDISSAGEYA
jgi:hypothetical protein